MDTFFGFNSTLNNGDNLLPPDDEDDGLENEEEYDALNDETFGRLEDATNLDDDWEQGHELFAEIEECSKYSDQIENYVSQLVLDEPEEAPSLSDSVWSYTPTTKNGGHFDSSDILSSLGKASLGFIETLKSPNTNQFNSGFQNQKSPRAPVHAKPAAPQIQTSTPNNKIRTVEELEKNLLKSGVKPPLQQPQHRPNLPPFHPLLNRFDGPPMPPPGLPPPPMYMPPPGLPRIPPNHPMNRPPMHPPGLMPMMLPPFMQQGGPPRPPMPQHPAYMHPNNPMGVKMYGHYMNYPPPQRMMNEMMNNGHNRGFPPPPPPQAQAPQRVRQDSGNFRHKEEVKDEYAGLMNTKEKHWLLNIQSLQLNTGTPYFHDYYYTIYKEKKAKNNNENNLDRMFRFPTGRMRNQERQENNNTLTPRVYTPLQFENSLGKLQCGSVTAPRKIIDMDIVTPEKDSDGPSVSRDTRKTKQYLLELETMYALLMKAEDLKNPLAISNMEKLREIKQKQRLRELELASTHEQKQEVLRLFKSESEVVEENQYDYIVKVVNGFLQEDKFTSFLNIRKGKMLLLRTLPHLTVDTFAGQLLEIWSRVLLSLPIIGRRDMMGDNILPKLYPFFKRYIQSSLMSDVLDIVTGLVEVVRQENSRSTPLKHLQGKAPLYSVLQNKFGVSALVTLLIRTEYLISTSAVSEKQQNDWSNFLVSWAELTVVITKVAMPLELIPQQIFTKHCNKFANLTIDKRTVLEKHFVDAN